MKKNYVILIVFLILVCYFLFKLTALNYYGISTPKNEPVEIEQLEIEHVELQSDYITFGKVKFKDVLNGYTISKEEKVFRAINLKNDVWTSGLQILIYPSFYNSLKEPDVYNNRISKRNIDNFFKQNNINNELDLYDFVYTAKYSDIKLFDSHKKMKDSFIKNILNFQIKLDAYKVGFVKEPYQAVVIYSKESISIILIVENDIYNINLSGEELTSEEVIKDFLNTLSVN